MRLYWPEYDVPTSERSFAGLRCWGVGLCRDSGRENGNYYSVLGLYTDNGKENGNYYLGFRVQG